MQAACLSRYRILLSCHAHVLLPATMQGSIVAVEDPSRNFYGFQFHPEVAHTGIIVLSAEVNIVLS